MLSNMSLAIFLVNTNVRCISVAYDQINSGGKLMPSDVKSFKTLDKGIKKDDLVILPTDTRFGYTVGKVQAVDLDVNYGSNEEMRWIVGRVDTTFIDQILEQEKGMKAKVHHAQVEDERKQLAEKLMAVNPNFGDIALISMGAVEQKDTYTVEPGQRGGAQSRYKPGDFVQFDPGDPNPRIPPDEDGIQFPD